jgi:hypothetical protein
VAVWAGREPAELLPLASPAGLTNSQADALIARIGQAKEHLAHANQLPRLRKDAAAAKKTFDKLQARSAAEIARLEAKVEEAAFVADTAHKAVYAAEDSASRLLLLHDDGLLLAELPREVSHLVERRTAEANANAAHQAVIAAKEERDSLRATVGNLEYRLAHTPIMAPLDQQHNENFLRDRLEKARAELAKSESKLKKAEAAHAAACKAIPASL